MKLNEVRIKNFRSIKYLQMDISSYIGMVGANEAGKSNILDAISLLSKDRTATADDIRDVLPDEKTADECYIWYILSYLDSDIENIYEDLKEQVFGLDMPIIIYKNEKINLLNFLKKKREVIYQLDIITNSRTFSHWRLDSKDYKICDNWYLVNESSPEQILSLNDSEEINLNKYKIVYLKEINDNIKQFLKPLTLNSLNSFVKESWLDDANIELPDVVKWEYIESNLLPGRINLTSFTSNPDTCIPLKNMFILSGFDDITNSITLAKSKKNGIRNLLNRVSENTTQHINTIWPEKKEIKIDLNINADIIEAGVQDEFNIYDFSRRSDGFKRFLTFLLMISAAAKSGELENNIILIDEPDLGLHPSGARSLQKELRNISKRNVVIFCTHSLFMIDRDKIQNHIIVVKEKETTSLKLNEKSDFLEEEILYNSIGCSVFDLIKQKNI